MPEQIPTTATATAAVKNAPSADEQKKVNAQLGAGFSKKQAEKLFLSETGKTFTLGAAEVKASDSVFIKKCVDCVFIVTEMTTKIFVEGCQNVKLQLDGKIITQTLEIWKCDDTVVDVNTAILTLQIDLCNRIDVTYKTQQDFNRLVWSAVEDLCLKFQDDAELTVKTGSKAMKLSNDIIVPETDQFIVRLLPNKVSGKTQILNELIVRLQNGYPTTEREARQFDIKQEANLQALAREILGEDVALGKKKDAGPKVGRNDACKCGSGKKYKKCCGTDLV